MLSASIRIVLACFAISLANKTLLGADALVGKKVTAANRVALDTIDHADWNQLLQQYVNEQGLVDYQSWKDSAESTQLLKSYLDHLSSADLDAKAAKEARLAYWINAYNAVTTQGILDKYPTESIRDHTPKLWGFHIWKNLKLQVDDQLVNLDSMEHQILRKMSEPRIHFAIVCASIGCPRLLNEAYTADQLDRQLELNAKNFFAQPRNFTVDKGNNTVTLSSILNWFEEDFGSNQKERLTKFSTWVTNAEDQAALSKPNIKVSYSTYDWGLNKQ